MVAAGLHGRLSLLLLLLQLVLLRCRLKLLLLHWLLLRRRLKLLLPLLVLLLGSRRLLLLLLLLRLMRLLGSRLSLALTRGGRWRRHLLLLPLL